MGLMVLNAAMAFHILLLMSRSVPRFFNCRIAFLVSCFDGLSVLVQSGVSAVVYLEAHQVKVGLVVLRNTLSIG